MVDRHPPQEVLIKMQPIITPAAPEIDKTKPINDSVSMNTVPETSKTLQQPRPPPSDVAKIKADIERINKNFPPVPPGAEMQTLSDAEFKQLVMATNSYEKERVFNLITALQAQLKEHQELLDRLDKSEVERKKLEERNRVLEEENANRDKRIQEQEERIQSLEGEVIELKLDLANEKGMVDHANLSIHQLEVRNKTLENENQGLKDRLSSVAESGEELIRTDFKCIMTPSSKATKSFLAGKGKRSNMTRLSTELASSTRTNFTEASTASGWSQISAISDSFFGRPVENVPSSGALTESSEESDSESPPKERNIVTLTKDWVSERVMKPGENKFGYY